MPPLLIYITENGACHVGMQSKQPKIQCWRPLSSGGSLVLLKLEHGRAGFVKAGWNDDTKVAKSQQNQLTALQATLSLKQFTACPTRAQQNVDAGLKVHSA